MPRARCFAFLTAAAFFAGLGLGYLKFYLLGLLTSLYEPVDKAWIIQAVGAIITLGPCVVYPISSPTAAAYCKRHVMAWSGWVTALVLLAGVLSGWAGSAWLYLFLSGM